MNATELSCSLADSDSTSNIWFLKGSNLENQSDHAPQESMGLQQ